MTVHVLHAGDGYAYLTDQVASNDVKREPGQSLSEYYLQHGNPPGQWVGAGLAALEVSGDVRTDQMKALFGEGLHPEADRIVAEAVARGVKPTQAINDARLGRRFPVFKEVENDVYPARLAAAYRAFGAEHDRAPEAGEERDALRWQTAVEILTESESKAPSPGDVTHYLSTRGTEQRKAVAGYDLVFTPVKSVSTLWALADDEVRETITRVHREAWGEALKWIEAEGAFTRVGAAGVAQIETNGLVATAFDHLDSRTGDPNLHTHVAVSTKVQGVDGKWRSLDGRVLHALGVAASERYNTAIENKLRQELGLRFLPEGRQGKRPVREIAGVPKDLRTAFSQRRAQVEEGYIELLAEYRRKHGREAPRAVQFALAQQATLATRQAKEGGGLRDRLPQWRATAERVLGGRRQVEAMVRDALAGAPKIAHPERFRETHPAETIDALASKVLETLGEQRATWNRWHVAAEAERVVRESRWAELAPAEEDLRPMIELVTTRAGATSIQLTPDDLNPAVEGLQRSNGESIYSVHGSQVFTSARVLAAEDALVTAAQSHGGLYVSRDAFMAGITMVEEEKGRTLNAGQRALAAHFAGSGRRLAAGIGPAGTGKTTAMSAFARAVELGGGRVLGLAPSAVAAAVLGDELGVSADTLHKLLWEHSHTPKELMAKKFRLDANTVLLVDEAGMAGTTELAELLQLAEKYGANIRLLGDPSQLAAVGSGGVLRLIDRYVGAAQLEEVHRFVQADGSLNVEEATASLRLREGDARGLNFYIEGDRVRGGTREAMLEDLYTAWSVDMAAGESALMVAPTNDVVVQLNTRARDDRITAGIVKGRAVELHDGSYAAMGDVIVTRNNDRRIKTGKTDWVKNGDLWRVTKRHHDGSLSAVHRDTNASVHLPPEYVREWVELGYAATIHRVQGMTVDTQHGMIDESMNRNQLYTGNTRGRYMNRMYVVTDAVLEVDLHEAPDPARAIRQTLEGVLARVDEEPTAFEALATSWDAAHSLAQLVPAYEDAYARLLEPGVRERIQATLQATLSPEAAAAVLADAAYAQLEARLLEIERTEKRDLAAAITEVIAADSRPIEGSKWPARALRARLGEASLPSEVDLPSWINGPPVLDDAPVQTGVHGVDRQVLVNSEFTTDHDNPAVVLNLAGLAPAEELMLSEQPVSQPARVVDQRAYDEAAGINQAAWEWWVQQNSRPEAWNTTYLMERGLAGTIATGWAPPGWDDLVTHLSKQGYTDDALLRAGVASRTRDGRLIDKFRDRIVVPVRDSQGRVVGVSARRNPTVTDDATPKYMNTPASEAYNKRELLLGWDETTAAALRDGARVMFVEGPMDRAAILALGLEGIVPLAPCGTALTDEQLNLVRDSGGDLSRAIFAFDGDKAGRMATSRAWERLTPHEALGASYLSLPAGSDPADMIHSGEHELLRGFVQWSGSLKETMVEQLLAEAPMDTVERRVATARRVAEMMVRLPEDLELEVYVTTRLAQHLDSEVVREIIHEARNIQVENDASGAVETEDGAAVAAVQQPAPIAAVDEEIRDWLGRHADLISERLDSLVADVEGPTPPEWSRELYRPPADARTLATWRSAMRSVVAYRDRYSVTGTDPLGPLLEDKGVQQRARAEATAALTILKPVTKPEPATTDQAQALEQARRQQELQRVRELRERLAAAQQTAPPPGMPLGLQPPAPSPDGPTIGL